MAKRNFPSAQSYFHSRNSSLLFRRSSAAFACLASLALLIFAVPAIAGTDTAPQTLSYARIVRLSYVHGDVQIVRTDKSNKWEPAVMNMPVEQGFAIGTNAGRAEVQFENGSMLWLAPNSVVQFTELALSDGGRISRITLSEGIASFDANLTSGETFEVDTPNFSITPSKNTEFKVGVRGKGAAVSVISGKVLVGDHGSTQEVVKGAMFADESGKTPQTALAKSPKPDQWDHWVNSRLTLDQHNTTVAMARANAPFTYGISDLAEYGSWNYYPGFGYGWQPWGLMASWAPFMDGNWMYYPTFGWTWISAEPWGWVPYHFGNWEYSPQFGWMWFPGGYGSWTAAPVQWFGVGKHIGWAPRHVGVSVSHPGSTGTPVVVTTKKLGHEGHHQVFSATEVSARMQSMKMRAIHFEPAENGKAARMNAMRTRMPAHVIVPTSSSLRALRTRLATNSGAKISVNALHQAPTSRVAIHGTPERTFAPVNAAMAARRIPRRPPMRTFGAPGMPGRYAGARPGVMRGPAPTSPAAPTAGAVPMPTARPSAGAKTSAPGRPR